MQQLGNGLLTSQQCTLKSSPQVKIKGSLSKRIFETRTATGREHFTCQDGGVSKIFILIISNGEKILTNVNVVVSRYDKRESSSRPVAVRVSKTRVLKLPKDLQLPLSLKTRSLDDAIQDFSLA